MKYLSRHGGFALVSVLIVTAIGLLFGAGALLLYRNQCQLRIDRQHELEKVYAVRSALNYIKPSDIAIPIEGQLLRYRTGSARDLNVLVKPVDDIFPLKRNLDFDYPKRHLATDRESMENYISFPSSSDLSSQYNLVYDYEFGGDEDVKAYECITNCYVETTTINKKTRTGIVFTNNTETTSKVWVNVGMRGTGGWLQEDFGRRYFFFLSQYDIGDCIRLCIIRNVTNENNNVGCRYGWPLSKPKNSNLGEKEMALVLEIKKTGVDSADMRYFIKKYGSVDSLDYLSNKQFPDAYQTQFQTTKYMGLQIARDKVSLFQINSLQNEEESYDVSSSGYIFSTQATIPEDVYAYFAKYYSEKERRWKIYDGKEKDENGRKIPAPELRVVFEVESAPKTSNKVLFDFRVTPAYQYDIFTVRPELAYINPYTHLKCFDLVTNRATVAQKILSSYDYHQAPRTVLTYDTHGTEMRGFRAEERERDRRARGE